MSRVGLDSDTPKDVVAPDVSCGCGAPRVVSDTGVSGTCSPEVGQACCVDRAAYSTDGTVGCSQLEEFLACDGATGVRHVVRLLGEIADVTPKDVPSRTASRVASTLNLNRRLYDGRDRFETVQLRAQIVCSLARSYVPDEAAPYLDDMLRNSQDPTTRAAAARAAGVLGPRGHALVPVLVRIVRGDQLASPVALGTLSPLDRPDTAWTTDRLEAVQALGRIGTPTDACLAALYAVASDSHTSSGRSAHAEAMPASDALEALQNARPATRFARVNTVPHSRRSERPDVLRATHVFIDQDGIRLPGTRWLGRPSIIAFFYTSCRNPGRCSTTTSHVIDLRRWLVDLQIESEVNVGLVTLEPQVDDPARLRAYGELRGMVFDERCRLLIPNPRTLDELTTAVDLSVSRYRDAVTNHEAALLLLDSHGRLTTRYTVGDPDLRMRTVAEELRHLVLADQGSEQT